MYCLGRNQKKNQENNNSHGCQFNLYLSKLAMMEKEYIGKAETGGNKTGSNWGIFTEIHT